MWGGGTYGECGVGVEEAFDYFEALGPEDLVPTVWHLERARGVHLVDFFGRGVDVVESARAVPDLHHGLLELGENALFFERSEGRCGRLVELLVDRLGWRSGVDGRLGLHHVMRYQGYRRL